MAHQFLKVAFPENAYRLTLSHQLFCLAVLQALFVPRQPSNILIADNKKRRLLSDSLSYRATNLSGHISRFPTRDTKRPCESHDFAVKWSFRAPIPGNRAIRLRANRLLDAPEPHLHVHARLLDSC